MMLKFNDLAIKRAVVESRPPENKTIACSLFATLLTPKYFM